MLVPILILILALHILLILTLSLIPIRIRSLLLIITTLATILLSSTITIMTIVITIISPQACGLNQEPNSHSARACAVPRNARRVSCGLGKENGLPVGAVVPEGAVAVCLKQPECRLQHPPQIKGAGYATSVCPRILRMILRSAGMHMCRSFLPHMRSDVAQHATTKWQTSEGYPCQMHQDQAIRRLHPRTAQSNSL